MKYISIIVPIYNVEKYLEKCIDSLINQTFKNFEIILVDDGSTDSSSEICKRYDEKYDFIKSYRKENGGLSDARNFGIDKSNGEYIIFIDSDDFISPYFLEKLAKIAKDNSADLVMSGLRDYYEGDNIDYEKDNSIEVFSLSKEKAYERMFLQDGIDVNSTAKLYKNFLFDKVRFPKGELYEDIQIVDKIIEQANNIYMTTFKGYYYLQRSDSIMYGAMSDKRKVLINKVENLLVFISKYYPNIKYSIVKRYVYCNFHILGRSILDDNFKDYSKELKNNILNYKKIILKEDIYNKKEKIATILLLISLELYKKVWSKYYKFK